MKGSVKLPVFIDDARKYVNTTQLRAKYLGASYEAEYCQWQALHGLGSLMETASLIITPNAYLEGKLIASYPPDPIGDFDVTRATTATRVNSAGLVELVPYNLFSYSQDFTNLSVWNAYNSTISGNTATAPDGTLTADSIVLTSAYGSRYQGVTFSSSLVTISAYFKKVDIAEVYIDAGGAGAYFGASFNLDTQATTLFGVASSAVVESVGNGWYRCSVVSVADGAKIIGIGIYGGVGGNSVYVWGAQANLGTIQPYQKTETRLNIPRLDYSNGTCPSLLVEPQRTNLLTYSSSFDNGAWSLGANVGTATITANNTIAPDGTLTADKLDFPAVGSPGQLSILYRAFTASVSAYNGSFYIKGQTGSEVVWISVTNDGVNYQRQECNLTTEWQRFDLSLSLALGTQYFQIGVDTRDSSQTARPAQTIYLWGAQLEAGSYATSYIPTTSASVTRNADVISKTGISSLIGQTEGVFYSEFTCDFKNPNGAIPIYLKGSGNSYSYSTYVQMGAGNFNVIVYSNGAAQLSLNSGTLTDGQMVKMAFAYKANDFVLYINGNQASSYNGGTPSIGMYAIDFGTYYAAPDTFQYDGSIKSFALWKERKDNAFLAQLTTI